MAAAVPEASDQGSLRSVRDFARKEWPLRGSTATRSAIADRRHPSGRHHPLAAPFGPRWGRGICEATVLIRSPYSCWLQRRAWAPYSPQRTRHLRPLPGTPSSLHGADDLHTHIDNLLSFGEAQAPSNFSLGGLGSYTGRSTQNVPYTKHAEEPTASRPLISGMCASPAAITCHGR